MCLYFTFIDKLKEGELDFTLVASPQTILLGPVTTKKTMHHLQPLIEMGVGKPAPGIKDGGRFMPLLNVKSIKKYFGHQRVTFWMLVVLSTISQVFNTFHFWLFITNHYDISCSRYSADKLKTLRLTYVWSFVGVHSLTAEKHDVKVKICV